MFQFMGIEIDQEYGGSGSSFMSSTLTVEEIAKVDPSVSVLVDLQNTLGNNVVIKMGNKEQKEKYLPRLAQNTVSCIFYFYRVKYLVLPMSISHGIA